MNAMDVLVAAVAGFLTWLMGTVFYGVFGPVLIEASFLIYALNAVVTAFAFGVVFRGVSRARRLDSRAWPFAAVAFALPGLALELMVFTNLNVLFVDASPASLGRYAGFIAFVYLTLPLMAWPSQTRSRVTPARSESPSRAAQPAR